MKKILITVLAVLFLGGVALADGISVTKDLGISIKDFNVKEGMAWEITGDSQKTYSLTTTEVVNWKDKVCLNAGIATDFNGKNLEVATLSYKIGGLEDLGFNYPLAKIINLEVGAYIGKDFLNTGDCKSKVSAGLQFSLAKVRF